MCFCDFDTALRTIRGCSPEAPGFTEERGMGMFRTVHALTVAGLLCAAAAEQGHFEEINGLVSIEAEEYLSKSGGGSVMTTSPQTGIPSPMSNAAIYYNCETRGNFSAKWKVTFTQTGTYKIWILGWGNDYAADNFNVFLGRTAGGTLRPMNARQNCSYNTHPDCPNYEASMVRGGSSLGWSDRHQCIPDRGCTGNTTTWTISAPGTYEMGIHNGDEPFESHEHGCNTVNNTVPSPRPYIVVDKFVITKTGTLPTGQGPPATRYGGAQASFSFSGVGAAPVTVSFDASASSASSGSITAYEWDFGDGATGSGQQTTHRYTANNSYTVTLTVRTSAGAVAQTSRVVTIVDPDDFVLKVNAGAGAMHGFAADRAWDGGYGYEGGDAVGPQGTAVSGTDADDVFSSVRHKDFAYRIAVPAAMTYTVDLLFAEHWREPGERVFKLDVEGVVTENIDIAGEVGNAVAYTITRTVNVSDGVLDVEAVRVNGDNPMISGIVVSAGEGSTATVRGAPWIAGKGTIARVRAAGGTLSATGLEPGDIVQVSTLQGRLIASVRAVSRSVCLPLQPGTGQVCVVRVVHRGQVCAYSVFAGPAR
ncbi:MAG: PKD domain-containing protein [Chitinivibrionales bacterium]|nr:PKD domain-containing protein [Chitinivibrionales bacterium]